MAIKNVLVEIHETDQFDLCCCCMIWTHRKTAENATLCTTCSQEIKPLDVMNLMKIYPMDIKLRVKEKRIPKPNNYQIGKVACGSRHINPILIEGFEK